MSAGGGERPPRLQVAYTSRFEVLLRALDGAVLNLDTAGEEWNQLAAALAPDAVRDLAADLCTARQALWSMVLLAQAAQQRTEGQPGVRALVAEALTVHITEHGPVTPEGIAAAAGAVSAAIGADPTEGGDPA